MHKKVWTEQCSWVMAGVWFRFDHRLLAPSDSLSDLCCLNTDLDSIQGSSSCGISLKPHGLLPPFLHGSLPDVQANEQYINFSNACWKRVPPALQIPLFMFKGGKQAEVSPFPRKTLARNQTLLKGSLVEHCDGINSCRLYLPFCARKCQAESSSSGCPQNR